MDAGDWKLYTSHGDGNFSNQDFLFLGDNVIFENGVLVFHPQQVSIASNVYIGHYSILKGYHKNILEVGANTWIGQYCFFHSGGGIKIGKAVGIGPAVKIITSFHDHYNRLPIMKNQLIFKPVIIEDGCDIGTNSIILPGVKIGQGAIVGAGSVVTKNIPSFSVAVGNPAKVIRMR